MEIHHGDKHSVYKTKDICQVESLKVIEVKLPICLFNEYFNIYSHVIEDDE